MFSISLAEKASLIQLIYSILKSIEKKCIVKISKITNKHLLFSYNAAYIPHKQTQICIWPLWTTCMQLIVDNLSRIVDNLYVANCGHFVANCGQPVANCGQFVANCRQPLANFGKSVANFGQFVANCEKSVANCGQFVANC